MADNSLFMDRQQLEAFNTALQGPTRHLVRRASSLDLTGSEKHQVVKDALIGFGVSRLQESVKELRGVPPEALAFAADLLISFVVGAIRSEVSDG